MNRTGPFAAIFVLSLCLLSAGRASALEVRLSELLYDAVGSDAGRVFAELYGPPGLDLAGLTLEGVNGSNGAVGPILSLSGTVPADGFFVVADEEGGTTLVPNADLLLDFDFQNGPDSVVLRGPAGGVLDALGYGVFGGGQVFAGEGTSAPDPPAGSSLARRVADLDTDDNGADFEVLEVPTPGFGPTAIPIPEPKSWLLLVASCLALVRIRRRY
jgi:hypothetical protein